MRRMRQGLNMIVVGVVLCSAGPVSAAGPTNAQKCEVAKLGAIVKKEACLAAERSKEVLGGTPNFTKCSTMFEADFTKIEARVGICPGTADAIEGLIDACFEDLKDTLSRSPPAPCQQFPAPVPQTGQTQCWDASGTLIACDGTGQDGDHQAGVPFPSPRFTENGNGTVTDNLTGLIWLKNADCFPGSGNGLTWEGSLQAANSLATPSCGLSDGSVAGDWRLPNRNELQSLLDFGFINPALSNAAGTAQWTDGDAFSGVQSGSYWSSTTLPEFPNRAWLIFLSNGEILPVLKVQITGHVWPVRSARGRSR
jgi:hypothetical protein